MNVAAMTAVAISHGLWLGFHGACSGAGLPVTPSAISW